MPVARNERKRVDAVPSGESDFGADIGERTHAIRWFVQDAPTNGVGLNDQPIELKRREHPLDQLLMERSRLGAVKEVYPPKGERRPVANLRAGERSVLQELEGSLRRPDSPCGVVRGKGYSVRIAVDGIPFGAPPAARAASRGDRSRCRAASAAPVRRAVRYGAGYRRTESLRRPASRTRTRSSIQRVG